MKLGTLIQALPAMQKLAGENLTPKTLYWTNKLLSRLEKDVDFFGQERSKLLKQYGEETEPDKWRVKPENIEAFEAAMKEIVDIDIEADFKVVKIPTTEKISLSYNDLRLLEGLAELNLVEEE